MASFLGTLIQVQLQPLQFLSAAPCLKRSSRRCVSAGLGIAEGDCGSVLSLRWSTVALTLPCPAPYRVSLFCHRVGIGANKRTVGRRRLPRCVALPLVGTYTSGSTACIPVCLPCRRDRHVYITSATSNPRVSCAVCGAWRPIYCGQTLQLQVPGTGVSREFVRMFLPNVDAVRPDAFCGAGGYVIYASSSLRFFDCCNCVTARLGFVPPCPQPWTFRVLELIAVVPEDSGSHPMSFTCLQRMRAAQTD